MCYVDNMKIVHVFAGWNLSFFDSLVILCVFTMFGLSPIMFVGLIFGLIKKEWIILKISSILFAVCLVIYFLYAATSSF